MGADSKIEWCHHTFNSWLGCSKIHAGCTNCYAEKSQAVTMRQGGAVQWGEVWQGGTRSVVADSTWKQPLAWARKAAREGVRRRVFCASLADVLEVPRLPDTWPQRWTSGQRHCARLQVSRAEEDLSAARARLWDVIRQTNRVEWDDVNGEKISEGGLDWLLLTKRPENWRLVPEDVRPLVWPGTSISDQETANEWTRRLLEAEGFRYRFLSVEPLVGPVDLQQFMWPTHDWWASPHRNRGEAAAAGAPHGRRRQALVNAHSQFIDWVIVGGESGPRARPCNVEWIRSIVRQCREAGVPCFVKQLGARPVVQHPLEPGALVVTRCVDKKGGDWDEWPEDLRVREVPGV